MVHSICYSYPKFGAAAPRQTGVITRRKKWGRLTPPPPANAGLISSVTKIIFRWQNCFISAALLAISVMQAFRSHHQHFGDELIKAVIDQHVGDFITNFGDGLIPCLIKMLINKMCWAMTLIMAAAHHSHSTCHSCDIAVTFHVKAAPGQLFRNVAAPLPMSHTKWM